MNDHYFSEIPFSKSERRQITVNLRGKDYTFTTDSGVFSKEHIDPGTKILIESLELSNVNRVLDLGCGYGVIGIVIAKEKPESTIHMSDPNKRAVELGRLNAEINQVTNVIIKEGEGLLPWINTKFDLVVSNPPIRVGKSIILDLCQQAKINLNIGGSFWVIIRTSQGAKSYLKEIKGIFGNSEVKEIKSGYRVIRAIKTDG